MWNDRAPNSISFAYIHLICITKDLSFNPCSWNYWKSIHQSQFWLVGWCFCFLLGNLDWRNKWRTLSAPESLNDCSDMTAILMCCAVPFEPIDDCIRYRCCCGRLNPEWNAEWNDADILDGRVIQLPDVVADTVVRNSSGAKMSVAVYKPPLPDDADDTTETEEEKSLTDWKLVGRDLRRIAHQFRSESSRNQQQSWLWTGVVFLIRWRIQRWIFG